jgi:hypothetical protein
MEVGLEKKCWKVGGRAGEDKDDDEQRKQIYGKGRTCRKCKCLEKITNKALLAMIPG